MNANEKLRNHIDSLFIDAPKTKKASELREELLSNLNAKLDDLLAGGMPEEEAYNTVINGIGDVDELIAALNRENVFDYASMQKERNRSAVLVSTAVGIYILSIAILILLATFLPVHGGEIGVMAMFVLMAGATSLLVYNSISHSRYQKADDTLVEEFKEWKSRNTQKNQLKKAISSILWPLIVVIYFIISFLFGAWAYSWIIFILGAVIQNIISVILDFKE